MKKTTTALLALAISTNLFAQIDYKDKHFDSLEEMQKFYYNLGKKEAQTIEYKKGYDQAIRDMRKLLRKYRDRIKSYENGKYLVEEGKITYPQVYKVRDGEGGYKIIIEPPKVTNEFSENDLFILPLIEMRDERVAQQSAENDSIGFIPYSDSLRIENTTNVKKALREFNSLEVTVYGDRKTKEILDKYGVKYTQNDGGTFTVYFSSEKDRESFCKSLTGDKECRGK